MKRIVILISGRGSNMQALINAQLPAKIAAVISNEALAEGLHIAKAAGIPTRVVSHKDYQSRTAFDQALTQAIDPFQPDLVVLAGFMRVLSANFVSHYDGKLINIHPSLLPAFPGLHTHEKALQSGATLHGCTVHFVNAQVDGGPIIVQASVPVMEADTAQSLASRVLEQEHRIFPLVVRLLCEGKLTLRNGSTVAHHTNHDPSMASEFDPTLVWPWLNRQT